MKNIISENKNSKCGLRNRLDAVEAKIIELEILPEWKENYSTGRQMHKIKLIIILKYTAQR